MFVMMSFIWKCALHMWVPNKCYLLMTMRTDGLESPLALNLSAFTRAACDEECCIPLPACWAFEPVIATFRTHRGGGTRTDNTRPYTHNANHSDENWKIQSIIWGFIYMAPNIWMTECFQFSPGWCHVELTLTRRTRECSQINKLWIKFAK